MTKAKVVMVNTKEMDFGNGMIERLEYLWNHDEVDVREWIKDGEIVAIKTHFGSRNQTRHLRSMYIRRIVDLVRKAGGIPWVCECCGLGWDAQNPEFCMANGPGFTNLANRHGFNMGSLNAPIVILDGVWGTDVFRVHNENSKYLKDIPVAMGLKTADKILVVSRFKGHDGAGFGGALKQLGIGCIGVEGKGKAHFGGPENIKVNTENCDGCGKCLRMCPTFALTLDEEQKIVLDQERCIGCRHCFSVCHSGKEKENKVFSNKKRIARVEQINRMMDNAVGVIKGVGTDRIRYINIAVDITAHCDCMTVGGHPLVSDQGILFSHDPLAIDQASVDLVTKAQGLPGSPAETGENSPYGRIEPQPEALEPNKQKLGLFSRWVEPESRSIIVETQLSVAATRSLGMRDYKLLDVTPEK